MPQPAETDEDGLTPLEQAIAKRLYERWADDSGEMTIRTDPRDVALHLRPVLPAPPVVDEAEIQRIVAQVAARTAHLSGVSVGWTYEVAAAVAARLRGETRG